MFNPDTAVNAGQFFFKSVEIAAQQLDVQLIRAPARNVADIESAISALAAMPGSGLIAIPDTFNIFHRELIARLTFDHRLPALSVRRSFVDAGLLISYGIDPIDQVRGAASYVDRILRGEKPADLPVQGPTKFELVINLKTAKALGLTVPPTLLAIADEVIE